jgi:hypothetical protein
MGQGSLDLSGGGNSSVVILELAFEAHMCETDVGILFCPLPFPSPSPESFFIGPGCAIASSRSLGQSISSVSFNQSVLSFLWSGSQDSHPLEDTRGNAAVFHLHALQP